MFYKDGVPCHSTALPRHIRQIPEIGERFSETIVASCNESCPTQPPAIESKICEIKDVTLTTIRSANKMLSLAHSLMGIEKINSPKQTQAH